MATEVASSKLVKPGFEEAVDSKVFPIRMTLTSRNPKALEQGIYWFPLIIHFNSFPKLACREIINKGAKIQVKVRGPARMPTKHLRITTRKTPCGEGSKTWDRFEMCIHKRVIDFQCTMNAMREIVNIYSIGSSY